MVTGLDLSRLPVYHHSAYKYFQPDEKHVTRRCSEDVLILMLDGTLFFSEEGHPIELQKGEYYIQRRGLRQEGLLPCTGASYYFIHFLGSYCENHDCLPLRGAFRTANCTESFKRMNLLQSTGGTAVETNAEFLTVLSELRKQIGLTEHKRIVHSLAAQITEDLSHPWNLEELAVRSGYSVNHLIHIFREETGQTPHSFLTELRLRAARMMLLASDTPLAQIAQECGFGGYVNFYKAFRSHYGCPPQEWRKNTRRG